MKLNLTTPPPPAAFTVDAAATYISVSRAMIWRLMKSGDLPRVHIMGRTVIRRVDLDSLLEKGIQPCDQETAAADR